MRAMLRFDGKKDPERRQALENGWPVNLAAVDTNEPDQHFLPGELAEYRKTSTTFAVRMDEPFEVETLEGLHTGKAGDFLAVGQAGEMYPIDAAVFAATYERVER